MSTVTGILVKCCLIYLVVILEIVKDSYGIEGCNVLWIVHHTHYHCLVVVVVPLFGTKIELKVVDAVFKQWQYSIRICIIGRFEV